MGLFDTIICKYKLPSHEDAMELKDINFNEMQYQTKDMDSGLSTYTIEEDGTLWLTKVTYEVVEGDPQGENLYDRLTHHEPIKSEQVRYPFYGAVNFYDFYVDDDLKNDYWVSYNAIFSEGKLISITAEPLKPTNSTDRKARDKARKEEAARFIVLQNKWYYKYLYAYYATAIRAVFRFYRKYSDKLPGSFKIERFLTPL